MELLILIAMGCNGSKVKFKYHFVVLGYRATKKNTGLARVNKHYGKISLPELTGWVAWWTGCSLGMKTSIS